MSKLDTTDYGSGFKPARIIGLENSVSRIDARLDALIERTKCRIITIQQTQMAFEARLDRIEREQVRQAVELRKGVPIER